MQKELKRNPNPPSREAAGSAVPYATRYTVLSSPPTCESNGLLLREALCTTEYRLQGCATKVLITVEPNVAGETQPTKSV